MNHLVFGDQDFAPSWSSSIVAHVPASFPSEFPSSDSAEHSGDELWPDSEPGNSDFNLLDDNGEVLGRQYLFAS